MDLKAISGERVTIELNGWEATWLARACHAAEVVCFGGSPEDVVATAKHVDHSALTGYLFGALRTMFEAAGAAAIAEQAAETKHHALASLTGKSKEPGHVAPVATSLDEMRSRSEPGNL